MANFSRDKKKILHYVSDPQIIPQGGEEERIVLVQDTSVNHFCSVCENGFAKVTLSFSLSFILDIFFHFFAWLFCSVLFWGRDYMD